MVMPKGDYKGHSESCFLVKGGKCHYPYTKNGKLNCGRVRNAIARASQQGQGGVMRKARRMLKSRCKK